jgi:hypothetical protein
MTENTISKFEELLKLNVNDKVEKKKSGKTELTYLSWAFAIAEMEKAYPEWEYNILEFNGLPYQFDPSTGYLVWTEIKAGGKTKRMWLPVMDGSNKAMKNTVQEYFVKGWNDAPPTKKTVEAATMFDINKTIMRCLVKNIAMFGIGLYIYAGEDLPEGEEVVKPKGNDRGFMKKEPSNSIADDQGMKDLKAAKKEMTLEEKKKKAEDFFKKVKGQFELCENLEQVHELEKEHGVAIKSLNKEEYGDIYPTLLEAIDFIKLGFAMKKESLKEKLAYEASLPNQ